MNLKYNREVLCEMYNFGEYSYHNGPSFDYSDTELLNILKTFENDFDTLYLETKEAMK